MTNEIERIAKSLDKIETGIATLKEDRAKREVWEPQIEKRLDHLYDKSIPDIKARLDKVESFQTKAGVYGGIALVVLPFLAPYIVKALFGG